MKRNGWHTLRSEVSVTVARRLPPRFDVEASARFPVARRGRLAHLVRQDLWRALQTVRGFSPVVEVATSDDGTIIRAGGQVAGSVPGNLEERIAAVIENPDNRKRWVKSSAIGNMAIHNPNMYRHIPNAPKSAEGVA